MAPAKKRYVTNGNTPPAALSARYVCIVRWSFSVQGTRQVGHGSPTTTWAPAQSVPLDANFNLFWSHWYPVSPWYNTLCIDYVDKCSTFLHDYTECEMFNFVHCRYWIRSEHFWWLDVLFLFIYKFKCHGKITMVRNRNQTVDICSKISPKLTETTSNSARAPKMMHAICSSECRFALKGQAQRIPCSLRIHVLTSVVSNNHEITIFFDHQITIK